MCWLKGLKELNFMRFQESLQEIEQFEDAEYRDLILCMSESKEYSLEDISYYLENVVDILAEREASISLDITMIKNCSIKNGRRLL